MTTGGKVTTRKATPEELASLAGKPPVGWRAAEAAKSEAEAYKKMNHWQRKQHRKSREGGL